MRQNLGLTPGTRLRVLRGRPTPEQLAALVLALDEAAAADVPPPAAPVSGWRRAARLEGLGGAPCEDAADPRLGRAGHQTR